MRYRMIVPCLLLLIWLAGGQQTRPEPDAGTVTNNTFESEFFKFRYSVPQGWATVNDDVRTAKNRTSHEDQVKKALADLPPDTENSKHTTQVFWSYDLIIATPQPLASGESEGLPHITVWARERFNMLSEPGDQAKLLAMFPNTKVLRKAEEVTISGRKFVRADFVHKGGSFEALFVTASGKYLLGFEIRGTSQKEINDLAKTMQTLKFL